MFHVHFGGTNVLLSSSVTSDAFKVPNAPITHLKGSTCLSSEERATLKALTTRGWFRAYTNFACGAFLSTASITVSTHTQNIEQAIERLTEGLKSSRQRAETAEALLEELQRGICPPLGPGSGAHRHSAPHGDSGNNSSSRSQHSYHHQHGRYQSDFSSRPVDSPENNR